MAEEKQQQETQECDYCNMASGKKKSRVVYEDDLCTAIAVSEPAAMGHVIILPKKHFNIIEQMPDKTVGHMFLLANKISTALFDNLGAHGTNIIVRNGVAAGQDSNHFKIHIIARRENDRLNFDWQPKQLPPEEMNSLEQKIKEHTGVVGQFEKEAAKPIQE